MEVYTIMFIIGCIFAIFADISKNSKYKKLVYTLLAFLPFILVASIRYDVGTDYMFRYAPDYQKMVLGNDVGNLEPLFKIIIKCCIFFSKDYSILFVVTASIMYLLIGITVYKNSKNILLSILVFFLGTYFFQSLNLVRQFLGMSVMFFAYKYIIDKKYLKWFVCLFVASMIHTSCLIFIITLFFSKKVFKVHWLIILVLLTCCIGYPMMKWVLFILGKSNNVNIQKYTNYISWNEKGLHLTAIVPEILIYIYYYIIYLNNKEKISREGTYLINSQFITIIFLFFNIYSSLFYRILLMFSFFQILSIPYFWNIYHLENNSIRYTKNIITFNTICCITIIMILSLRMIYSSFIKNNNEILPYKTIWERE